MSPREIFALRDYLGPELKGRTISDARRVVSLTDILRADLPGRPLRRTLRTLGAARGFRSADLGARDDRNRRRGAANAAVSARSQRRSRSSPDRRCRNRCHRHRPAAALGGCRACIWWWRPGRRCAAAAKPKTERATEWLMLTSGTSGVPKIVGHTLEGSDRRDRRRRSGARHSAGMGDVLRHPPLWRPSDLPARHHRRRLDGAVRARRSARRSCRAASRARRHAYFRHAVALAQAFDERIGRGLFAALRSPVGRDRRPGGARRACARPFPHASIGHAYASTEAGVGFAVNDGLEGFPAEHDRRQTATASR